MDSPTLGNPALQRRSSRSMHKEMFKKHVNFSRPVVARSSAGVVYAQERHSEERHVKAVQAYYEPESVLPTWPEEPRFSLDSDPGLNQALGDSGHLRRIETQELAWDGERGEMVSRRRLPSRIEEQRHPGLGIRKNSSTSSSSKLSTSHSSDGDTITTDRSGSTQRSGSLQPVVPIKSILKKTEVEQYSEHGSEAGGSTTTYKTGSETSSGTYDRQGNWHSSDVDTSCLSEKELKRLERKGINPSLYIEMKKARGNSRFGALTGNSFIG
ncbi:hypothetical protein CB0940_04979 [Cercospora beticola]|uniref:Uncharacterized protein n=1 Tax=Cercospora beticola TaxID=122368 RepID=A0A2G5HJ58_CERBT|nr:hypothetical protein CB0940_04979 [Cercospora beticola]PIA92594.1 hypothetical protein CB0940_04979 [Cercospora beticola]WPB02267.1 hypothetical protein RHO25_006901 [Cercospora beticola]CAK1362865.1 unnamed protein product [Cercospora beticola]